MNNKLKPVKIVFDIPELLERVRAEIAWLNLGLSPNLDRDEPQIAWREYNDCERIDVEARELISDLAGKLSAWNAEVNTEDADISIILYVLNNSVKALASIEAHLARYLKCRLLARKLEMSVACTGCARVHYEQLMEQSATLLNDVYEILCLTEY